MSDAERRVVTQEALDRLHLARRRGDLCAACGKALGADKPVFWEPVIVDIDRSDLGLGHYTAAPEAPVGMECASPGMLEQTRGRQPERCAGCGRGVYYGADRSRRQRALCSRRCAGRANLSKRATEAGEG
jgi:hypothetical protein